MPVRSRPVRCAVLRRQMRDRSPADLRHIERATWQKRTFSAYGQLCIDMQAGPLSSRWMQREPVPIWMFGVQSDYHDAMKVFLSYQMEDGLFREDFSRNVADIESTVIFRDYPKMNRFDREWRQRCSELIRECVGTVVLVGHTTYQSQPVAWEIAETKRQSLPAIGVILRGMGQPSIPRGLGHGDVIPVSDIGAVVSHIRSWSA